ncbi:MAG: LytTR family DNA-binding domain-containing protein [Bacteroidales bacterium]
MENTFSCLAIDDEQGSLDTIREFCARLGYLDLAGTYTNAFEAVNALNRNHVDLLFLNTHMPGISGLDLMKSLYDPPVLILTSPSRDFAWEGFEHDAADYLIKPIGFDRFSRSVSKAIRFLSRENHTAGKLSGADEVAHGFLMVKVEYTTIRVNLNDILYIEGLKDYVKIYTEGKLILTKTTMKNIGEKLPSRSFFRVHKSYIVSVDRIDMIENSRIVIGNQRIPIGESYRSLFFNMINKNLV